LHILGGFLGKSFVWEVVDTGREPADVIMRRDAELLEGLNPEGAAVLHLYEWEGDSVTYGYFLKPHEFLDLEAVERRGVKLARRPTGGGIVFHIWDMAFSVLVPSKHPAFSENTLENYQFVNRAVLGAVEEMVGERPDLIPSDGAAADLNCTRFCMAQPTKYDVVLGGRKIAGAAQRKKRNGFLHQGTISLTPPDEALLKEVLLPGTRVLEAMRASSFFLLPQSTGVAEAKRELQKRLIHHLEKGTK
jgi:lipoate-protein ligase A